MQRRKRSDVSRGALQSLFVLMQGASNYLPVSREIKLYNALPLRTLILMLPFLDILPDSVRRLH